MTKMEQAYDKINSMDTYQIIKDLVDNAQTDATTEEEFFHLADNNLQDLIDQVRKAQTILNTEAETCEYKDEVIKQLNHQPHKF